MLPAAASFKKQGANRGALAAFLVSTPESGADSIAVTYALLDPIMTVARPLAALVTGVTAGLLENSLTWNKTDPTAQGQPVSLTMAPEDPALPGGSLAARLRSGLRYGFREVWADIALWFFVGLFLAGIITVYLPEGLSQMMLGGGILAMLAMLLMGMPIYICATASTPVAAALLLKGASPGVVLVFLLVGPATNLTSLSVLIRILGRLGTLRYLLVIAVVSILFGMGLDGLYQYLDIEARALLSEVRETVPHWLKLSSALVLLGLLVQQLVERCRLAGLRRGRNQCITGFPTIADSLKNTQRHGKVPVLVQPVKKSEIKKE